MKLALQRVFELLNQFYRSIGGNYRNVRSLTVMNGPMEEHIRVLSIQSHVVHGYVGNRCATFPLQLAGFDVDAINSVQFSNHTGYGKWKGEVISSDQLWKLYEGLCENSLNEYTHVLTGYTNSAACLQEIARIIVDLRKRNPGLCYICDPVMGDNGTFYVSEDVVPIYRDVIIPLADIVTPNQFELEAVHDRGVKTVVVTSMNDKENDKSLLGYGSQLKPDGHVDLFKYEIPRIDAYFVGTGDLFATLLLISMKRSHNSLKPALENVLSALQAVLRRTVEYARSKRGNNQLTSKDLELRLVQSRADLLSPTRTVTVSQLETGNN